MLHKYSFNTELDLTKRFNDEILMEEIGMQTSVLERRAVDAERDVEDMKKAVSIASGKAEIECSGNVTKENVERLVDIGVDYISSGALTHSSPILDLSLKNLRAV